MTLTQWITCDLKLRDALKLVVDDEYRAELSDAQMSAVVMIEAALQALAQIKKDKGL